MIGFIKQPTGRMGNVLIQYCYLRQLAERIETEYFHPTLPYAKYFCGFERKKIPLKKRLTSKRHDVSNQEIEQMGTEKFICDCRERIKKNQIIVLNPPVLGHLFEFKEENPGKFICLKKENIKLDKRKQYDLILGIHFRGTDFKGWNEKASLPFEYYANAIQYLINKYEGIKIGVKIFTDDNNFESYKKTLQYINMCAPRLDVIYMSNVQNTMIEDFEELSQCDWIISSPSTYAIMAGLVGKQHKCIIHAKQWVEYAVANGDAFWIDIQKQQVPYYDVVKIL